MATFLYKELDSTPRLANVIQRYWLGEVATAPGRPFTHVATAQSRAQVLFHYQGEFASTDLKNNTRKNLVAGFYGPSLLPQQYTTCARQAGIFGIQLSPWAIPVLFSVPASELTNQAVALADLLGPGSEELEEKLLAAATGEERARVTSAFFEKRLRPQRVFPGMKHAIEQVYRTKGQVAIESLVNLSCLSKRQFERNFRQLTGFSAQTYSRIVRFEDMIGKLGSANEKLTDFALACGYYDQAHFNHDFKSFTGLSPRQYRALNSFSS